MNKKNSLVAAGLGLAQLALISSAALAQEPLRALQTDSIRTLNEVVVTATRSPRKQSEIGKVVRVITAAQLEASQGRTLPEVLNNVAGLAVSGTGNAAGSNLTVYMRGAARGNALILIDGIPANNASDINNDYDISSIAIDQIERVEILRGANSTLYGSDAVAGVINIITKQPSAAKLKANVLLSAGSYNTNKEAFGLNGGIDKTSLAVNFSNTRSKGFSVAKDKSGNGNFDKDGFDQQALSTHLKQQLTEKLSLTGNLQLNRNAFDLDGGAFVDDIDYKGKNVTLFGGANAKYQLPSGALNFIVNQNNAWNTFNNPDGATYFSRQNNKGKITYSEIILNHRLFPQADITAGVNYRHANTSQAYESLSKFGPYNSYLTTGDAKNSILSTYASVFYKASNFNFELGGRYNHHSIYGNNVTYTINPSYVFADRFKVFVNVASAFKAPSLYQLTSQYKNKLGLDPETTSSYETGADLELIPSKVNLSATGFIRNTENILYFYTDPKTFASEYRNGNLQKDKGFEVELNTKPLTGVNFNVWYAFVKGRGEDYKGTSVDYLLRRPKNSFGATAGYQIGKAASVNLLYKRTGSRLDPYYDSSLFKVVNLEQKAFSVLDVYGQINPIPKITLFADVKNILDEKYTEWEGYNTKGRNFNIGLKFDVN